jgi:hypothetical protein
MPRGKRSASVQTHDTVVKDEPSATKRAKKEPPATKANCWLFLLNDDTLRLMFSYLIDLHCCTQDTLLSNRHEEAILKRTRSLQRGYGSLQRGYGERAFPESYAQILMEKKLHCSLQARALKFFSLICKRFHGVIADPTHDDFFYSGMYKRLKTQYMLEDNVTDVLDLDGLFDSLFNRKSHEMMKSSESLLPIRIQMDNKDESRGFWYGRHPSNTKYSDYKCAAKNLSYSLVTVSDHDRLVYIREGDFGDDFECNYRLQKLLADPRFEFFVLELMGTPKPASLKVKELSMWVDSKLCKLRSVLTRSSFFPHPPMPFVECLEWCESTAEDFEEDGVDYIKPDIERVLDSIVSWAVRDFEEGCQHYISSDVLFHTGDRGETGWDNWTVCSGSSEYFVPLMVMDPY